MRKEYLEAFKNIMKVYGNTNSLEGTYDDFLTIKKALQRLEAIDNANPSEALKCLETIDENIGKILFNKSEYIDLENLNETATCLKTVRQVLLKSQEQEKENANSNEALELFEEFKDILLKNVLFLDTDLQELNGIKRYILKSQEQEKVLKILKEKEVAIDELKRCIRKEGDNALDEYNAFAGDKNSLTQEEFNLLKKVINKSRN